jgi:dTDP-4-dehydrorhamnose reductase
MSSKRVVVLGESGMLGGYVAAYLRSKNFEVATPERFDAKTIHAKTLETILQKENPTAVVNCIGIIKQRNATSKEMKKVNGEFPHVLQSACEKVGATLVHISTDCVFDGNRGKYTEEDPPDEIDSYGRSKAKGEPLGATTIRTSIIGSEKRNKLGLLEWVKSQQGKTVHGYTNHFWNGVTTLQLAKHIAEILDSGEYWKGVRHYFSPQDVSKYELVKMISDAYKLGVVVEPFETETPCDRTLRSVYTFPTVPSILEQLQELQEFDTHYLHEI